MLFLVTSFFFFFYSLPRALSFLPSQRRAIFFSGRCCICADTRFRGCFILRTIRVSFIYNGKPGKCSVYFFDGRECYRGGIGFTSARRICISESRNYGRSRVSLSPNVLSRVLIYLLHFLLSVSSSLLASARVVL